MLGRSARMCAAITLAALWSLPAVAELPTHQIVAHLGPTSAESRLSDDPDFPFPLRNSHFGAAVAIRNGIAFVGIPDAFPTAHAAVYGQTATGWVRTATLSVPDAVPAGFSSNGFGRALTFRDGLAVIGSHTFVHVFRRGNGVWTDVQKLEPPTPGPAEVQAIRYENGFLAIAWSSFSVVDVYELASSGKLLKRATLKATDGNAGFGADVAVAGNVLVVGANGAAYVFRRRSDGTWVRTQKLIAADSSPVGSFGAAVAIDQGMIIVGAPDQDCVDNGSHFFCVGESSKNGAGGAAYGFVPFNGRYMQVFKLRPGAQEHSNYFDFGRRITMMGKYIVIDAAKQEYARDPDISFPVILGVAFTYTRDGSTLTARGLTQGHIVTDAMGLANNRLLVGSVQDGGIGCTAFGACFGEAMIFDLNRFAQ